MAVRTTYSIHPNSLETVLPTVRICTAPLYPGGRYWLDLIWDGREVTIHGLTLSLAQELGERILREVARLRTTAQASTPTPTTVEQFLDATDAGPQSEELPEVVRLSHAQAKELLAEAMDTKPLAVPAPTPGGTPKADDFPF